MENKQWTKFYINYIMRKPYWKNEINLRNHLNDKVRGTVVGHEMKIIFNACLEYIQTIPFNSQEADIMIAGLSVWSRTLEDSRYAPEPLSYYPQKSCSEIFKICYGDIAPDDVRGNDMIIEIIKKIGHHALIEKDLEFDGMMSRFMDDRFDNRDWRDFTDRFIKYGF